MLDKHNQSSPRVIQDISCLPLVKYKGTPARIRHKPYFTPTHIADNKPMEVTAVFSCGGWSRSYLAVSNPK